MKPEVTVIVPVYNVEKFLPDCLDSLIGQTLKKIAIICVNDSSTDSSSDILKKYAEKDKRISVINKKNGGLSSSRNAGLKQCKTEFVMFCDGDDGFAPTMCEKMVKAIKDSEADFAACGVDVQYLADKELKKSDDEYYRIKYCGKRRLSHNIILNTDVSVCNKIFRMSTIKKYDITFPEGLNNEDFYFYNAYAGVSRVAYFVDEKLYNYIRREGSIMNQDFARESLSLDHLIVAEKLFDFYKKIKREQSNINLLWRLWINSYWFSVCHSSSKSIRAIRQHAKQFVKGKQDCLALADQEIQNFINRNVLSSGFSRFVRRVVRFIFNGDWLTKVSVGTRQRRFIERKICDITADCNKFIEKIKKD